MGALMMKNTRLILNMLLSIMVMQQSGAAPAQPAPTQAPPRLL